eukprot:3431090-Rhodomonas_salina.2
MVCIAIGSDRTEGEWASTQTRGKGSGLLWRFTKDAVRQCWDVGTAGGTDLKSHPSPVSQWLLRCHAESEPEMTDWYPGRQVRTDRSKLVSLRFYFKHVLRTLVFILSPFTAATLRFRKGRAAKDEEVDEDKEEVELRTASLRIVLASE